MILWVAWAARAEPCADLEPPPDRLSVVWFSPARRRVAAHAWLDVVPATDLRDWLGDDRSPGRVLASVGARSRAEDPRRPWKAVVFDVSASDLCRPAEGFEPGEEVAGVVTCPGSLNRSCTTEDNIPLYRVQWSDAARAGFCVLPLERYLAAEQ